MGRRSLEPQAADPPAPPNRPPGTQPAAGLLLLHGQPGGARDWDGVLDALGRRGAPGSLVPDRPGWDGGRRPAAGLAANAVAALAELDAAGVETAVVAGHSFGAAVAAWLAAHHPERIERLVLVAPAANRASLLTIDRLLGTPVAGYLASSSLLAVSGLTLRIGHARRWLAGRLELDERLLADSARALRSPGSWHAFAVEQRALIRELPELEARLGAIAAPTTIVIGTEDRIVYPSSARQLATQIPGAELVEIPGAHHLLPFQHPRRLAAVIAGA
jgi:pimeloyl-ACP methyl ester carboxylesterase